MKPTLYAILAASVVAASVPSVVEAQQDSLEVAVMQSQQLPGLINDLKMYGDSASTYGGAWTYREFNPILGKDVKMVYFEDVSPDVADSLGLGEQMAGQDVFIARISASGTRFEDYAKDIEFYHIRGSHFMQLRLYDGVSVTAMPRVAIPDLGANTLLSYADDMFWVITMETRIQHKE